VYDTAANKYLNTW